MVPYEFQSTGLTASHLRSCLGAMTTKTGILLPIVQANYNTDGSVCVRKVGHVTEIHQHQRHGVDGPMLGICSHHISSQPGNIFGQT